MSGAKFTPGPWSFHLDDTVRNSGCTRVICKIEAPFIILDGEGQANAHLIAAAPEMYEVLNILKDFNCSLDYMSDSEFQAFLAIDDILAKARGES